MSESTTHPDYLIIRRTALIALGAGVVLMFAKFGVYMATNSVAVFSDAMESLVNISAAAFMAFSLWYANRPADKDHPYGHGKIEFLAIGLEAWMILFAGVMILIEAIRRLIFGEEMPKADLAVILLSAIGVLHAALASYLYVMGKRYDSPVLAAHAKHLFTDVATTIGIIIGLLLVHWTQWQRLDPIVAILVAGLALFVCWHLMWQSINGLMDRRDPKDEATITRILDQAVADGEILGYHKVRHRHVGQMHWVDMHLQMPGEKTVRQSHAAAAAIENRIEQTLGHANATAHVEPEEKLQQDPGPLPANQGEAHDTTTTPGNAPDGEIQAEEKQPPS